MTPYSSLRKSTNRIIKQKYPKLYPKSLSVIEGYLTDLSRKQSWWRVLILVILLLGIMVLVHPSFLGFIWFDDKTASTIIDQRTSNVATIISMTLAVTGLLLSNLVIKDPQTYGLLFVNSGLYFIIYYTLSVILCLILISTLRDTLPTELFHRLVLGGTYLSITILFAIGHLFRTIIKFTDPNQIDRMHRSKLLEEARFNLRINLLFKYSQISFLELMKEFKITEYKSSFTIMTGATIIDTHTSQQFPEDVLIYDINLKALHKELSKDDSKTSKYYSTPFGINMLTTNQNSYIFPNVGGTNRKQMKLIRCLTLKHRSKQILQSTEHSSYLDKQLEQYIEAGKSKKIGEVLAVYSELYKLKMQHD